MDFSEAFPTMDFMGDSQAMVSVDIPDTTGKQIIQMKDLSVRGLSFVFKKVYTLHLYGKYKVIVLTGLLVVTI